MNFKKLSLVTAVGAALVGCGADDQAYETVSKPDQQFAKSNIKTDQVYLFMPSLAKAPKYAVSMKPFYPGQEKLVTLSFEGSFDNDSSGGLKATLLNPDLISQNEIDDGKLGRWLDEQSNAQPILTIPGDFVDYQCREDSYGDCTNKEEKVDNNEVPWDKRNYFLPKFANVKVHQYNWVEPSRLDTCYSKSGDAKLVSNSESGWKGYEVTSDGVINFEVEQSYKVKDGYCLFKEYFQQGMDLDNLSFTVSQFYSLVPLDLVRSKSEEYEPIVYQRYDSDRFGYFANKVGRPDVSYSRNEWDNEFEYLHRFNPNKDVIDYHLSDSFDVNEETKFFKKVTQETIERMNGQLSKVGVPHIKLHEPSGKHAGDLRYNVIHLIDEPLDNGLAGLGPTAVNPLTGEIVHGHVNQYSGVIRAGSSWRWDIIATDFNKGRVDTTPKESDTQSTDTNTTSQSNGLSAQQYAEHTDLNSLEQAPERMEYESVDQLAGIVSQEIAHMSHEGSTFEQTESMRALEKRLWAENNMYPLESLAQGVIHVTNLPKVIGGLTFDYLAPEWWTGGAENAGKAGYLKTWSELTAKQQERLSLFIAGVSYAQVLVHEFGHNLGLRHNFKGSIDSQNYFNKDKLSDHSLKTVPGYASIMDYNGSFYDEPVFGPYDLAALRFGYKRQVEVEQVAEADLTALSEKHSVEGTFVSVASLDSQLLQESLDPLSERSDLSEFGVMRVLGQEPELAYANGTNKIKQYKYCTDGHVSLNDDCNRWDSGANRVEIIEDRFRKYDEFYERSTTRGMRESFSEYSQINYLFRRLNLFLDWRNSTHNFERSMGDALADHQVLIRPNVNKAFFEANPNHWAFGSYYGTPVSVDKVRDKLLSILSTTDHVCEVKNADGTFDHIKLASVISNFDNRNNFEINEVPTSCFDEGVVTSLTESNQTVIAETGKYLNSGSAPRSAAENNYSNLIDYMGNWNDVLAASVALVDRVGDRSRFSTNRSTLSLIELSKISSYDPVSGNYRYLPEYGMRWVDSLILGTEFNATFRNQAGDVVPSNIEFPVFSWANEIEKTPYRANWMLSIKFGLPAYQEIKLNKAILNSMLVNSVGNMVDQRDEVFGRKISMRSELPGASSVREYKRSNGRTYYAAEENTYAWSMIEFVEEFEALEEIREQGGDYSTLTLNQITLADYQDAAKREGLEKSYAYQKQSLEYLPVYNNRNELRVDIHSH